MKYIRHKTLGLIAFEPGHDHKQIARRLGLDEKDLLSAGFLGTGRANDVYCFGRSPALGMTADVFDTVRLQAMMNAAKGMAE